MDTDATRRYRLPTHLSMKLPQYRQYFNPPSLAAPLRDIPDPHDLFNIKEDLENIASEPETRTQRLQRDLAHLLENVKVLETPPEQKPRPVTGGKNMEVVMERMRKQQQQQQQQQQQHATVKDDPYESGITNGNGMRHNASRISKNQLERQAALEALKRRRRRDDSEESFEGIVPSRARRSDSPPADAIQNARKRKSMEDATTLYNGKQRQQSAQPPPTPPPSADHVKKQKNNHSTVDEELDFVRVKPSQQVPIFTFWQAMEPYFRPLTEEDRIFLMKKEEEHESTFEVPPLGKHYLEQWNEEDRIATERHSSRASDLLDDGSREGLLERLLSTLIPEYEEQQQHDDMMDHDEDDDDDDDDDEDSYDEDEDPDAIISHYEQPETPSFEDRLRQEMQYIGILSDDVDEHNWNAREDDDISAEIRRLGRELKEQINTNNYRKSRLLQVVDTQLQYDQYRQVLDALEVQVEQSYMKRFRVQKAKKRKAGSSAKAGLSENTIAAMEKRSMFIKELGPLFVDKNLVLPSHSIYEDA